MWLKILLCTLIGLLTSIDGAHILFLTPTTAHSHSSFFKPVIKELAVRGHTVTWWSGLREHEKQKNVRHVFSEESSKNFESYIGFHVLGHPFRLLFTLADRLEQSCSAIFRDPIFLQLKNSTEDFDAIVVDAVLNDCVLPLIHFLNKPLIYMNVIVPMPWLLDSLGSPLSLTHFPVPGLDFTDRMNLLERTSNTLVALMGYYYRSWVMAPSVDRVARRMLKDPSLPPMREIEKKHLSMLITNTHLSVNYQLPLMASIVEAGGLHCISSKPLNQELEEFIDGSGEAGFIIVSFGSILKGADLPLQFRDILLSTFARLPQRIVWKWENELEFADSVIPPNVKLMPWIPQQDLLGHPRARLFITHGGLFSIQEAVFHGVPLIGLPVFIDQPINVKKAEQDGYAIHLPWDTLTEQGLYDAIQQVSTNPRYSENVKNLSKLLRDQLESPLDRAVFSIEYVIRHRGAPHLRPASRELSLFERSMLDVILVLTFLCIGILYLCLYATGCLFKKIASYNRQLAVKDITKKVK